MQWTSFETHVVLQKLVHYTSRNSVQAAGSISPRRELDFERPPAVARAAASAQRLSGTTRIFALVLSPRWQVSCPLRNVSTPGIAIGYVRQAPLPSSIPFGSVFRLRIEQPQGSDPLHIAQLRTLMATACEHWTFGIPQCSNSGCIAVHFRVASVFGNLPANMT